MLLGVRLKALRLEKGMTQDDIAKKLNVTKSTISYYENDKRTPTVANLHELAYLMGVSFDYLVGNDSYVVADNDEKYGATMSKEEIEFVKEIRRYANLYEKVIENPKRFVELINKRLS